MSDLTDDHDPQVVRQQLRGTRGQIGDGANKAGQYDNQSLGHATWNFLHDEREDRVNNREDGEEEADPRLAEFEVFHADCQDGLLVTVNEELHDASEGAKHTPAVGQ